MVTAVPAIEERDVLAAIADVHDPEIPQVSIVDLGIVHSVEVGPAEIRVELLPTFVGCPAIDVIRSAVKERLSRFGRPVDVSVSFEVPWTSDRITTDGRDRLREAGFAPPSDPADLRCPYCDSGRVSVDNLFGPTLCRSLYYCRECRQPFEAFKPI
jgi:ring-1,2-phenylacetyl-CoA epoxidase subunit PaaD